MIFYRHCLLHSVFCFCLLFFVFLIHEFKLEAFKSQEDETQKIIIDFFFHVQCNFVFLLRHRMWWIIAIDLAFAIWVSQPTSQLRVKTIGAYWKSFSLCCNSIKKILTFPWSDFLASNRAQHAKESYKLFHHFIKIS